MRVNNGLTPQELEAYGISDVHDIVYNPTSRPAVNEKADPDLTGYEQSCKSSHHHRYRISPVISPKRSSDHGDLPLAILFWGRSKAAASSNKPLSPETWQHLKGLVTKQLSRQTSVRCRRLLWCEPGYSSFRPFHHRSGLAGAFCQKHVYSPER